MVHMSMASLAAATMLSAALTATPALAGSRSGVGRGVGFVGEQALNGFVGRPAFAGRSRFVGRSEPALNGFVGRPAFVRLALGVGVYAGYAGCGRLVPTAFGWQRVWVCDSYY
jgi:hypothetical protein